jgi:hypothetical protein
MTGRRHPLWLVSSISGKTSFPTTGGGTSIDVDADDIISDLNGAFMGSLEFQRTLGLWIDVIYFIDGSESATQNATIGRRAIQWRHLNANLEIKSCVVARRHLQRDRHTRALDAAVGRRAVSRRRTDARLRSTATSARCRWRRPGRAP